VPLAASIDLPDRYRVVRHIASGGMASVWEVEDTLLGRLVAVKVLGAHFAADPGARARFQREARTAAQVSDQTHVVTIYDIGEHGDDAFIVMEHFSGGTVADRLRAARDAGERIPRQTALRWLREAATGLDVAHAAGIVHRDVKPANLLLDGQDRLAVGDFGIARLADDTQMTQTGQVLGTAAYISPEQALGQPATDASDRYALAVVAHELLTGSRPFTGGPPAAQARQHAEAMPAPASQAAPDLPPGLDGVLARGMAKDPARRPRSATELVAGIEAALAGAPASASDGRPIEATRPFAPVIAAKPAGRAREPAVPAPPAGRAREPAVPAPPAGRAREPAAAAQAQPREPATAGRARVTPLQPSPPRQAPASRDSEPSTADAHRAAPAVAPTDPRGRRRPMPALLAATLVVAAVIALVLVLAGGRDEPTKTANQRTTTNEASRTSTTPAAAPQPPPPPAAAAEPTTSGATKPAALHARAFQLVKQGRYGEAVAPAQAAVQGYRDAGETSGLPFAYALFNLAVALNRSGNPAAAIPLLQERLKFNDQRATVQAELDSAQAKVGGGTAAAPAPPPGKGKGNGKKDKRDKE
jgi:tetratricopeptide (TPR) repeat protein